MYMHTHTDGRAIRVNLEISNLRLPIQTFIRPWQRSPIVQRRANRNRVYTLADRTIHRFFRRRGRRFRFWSRSSIKLGRFRAKYAELANHRETARSESKRSIFSDNVSGPLSASWRDYRIRHVVKKRNYNFLSTIDRSELVVASMKMTR